MLILHFGEEQSRLSPVKTGLHACAHTPNIIWPWLGSRSVTLADGLWASSLSSVWHAGAHDYLSERWGNTSKHHGYLIWDNTHSSPPLTSKGFERCCTDVCCRGTWQWEEALTLCELTALTYCIHCPSPRVPVVKVFIVFDAGKHSTLSLIHGWDWTQEKSLVPTGMNDACDAWLGCISGLLYTAVVWCLRWFI